MHKILYFHTSIKYSIYRYVLSLVMIITRSWTVLILSVCLFFLSSTSKAASSVPVSKRDTLKLLLTETDIEKRQTMMMDYLYLHFLYTDTYDQSFGKVQQTINTVDAEDSRGISDFMRGLICYRKFQFPDAEAYLIKAITFAHETKNDFLLYHYYSVLAYTQVNNGNALGSVHSYQLARNKTEILDNKVYRLKNDVNLASLYMSLDLYTEAIFHLNEAENLISQVPDDDDLNKTYVYYNKGEVSFKLGQLDSLQFYADKLSRVNDAVLDVVRLRKRLTYFLLMLGHDYKQSISIINEILVADKLDADLDISNLAECYYRSGAIDSAASVQKLILDDKKYNDNGIRHRALIMLTEIAEKKDNLSEAYHYSKLATLEQEKFLKKLIGVGNISSQIRLDQNEASFMEKMLQYQKERTVMLIIIVSIVLMLIILILLYINIKQKRNIEQLLHKQKTREAAFVSSHEVRKHLANILGLCKLLDSPEIKNEDIQIYGQYIKKSAVDMDESLKLVEDKLRE